MLTKHTTFHYNIANLEICMIPTYTELVLNVLSRSYFRICACSRVCVCAIIISEKREHDLKKSGDEYLEGMEEERKEKCCN